METFINGLTYICFLSQVIFLLNSFWVFLTSPLIQYTFKSLKIIKFIYLPFIRVKKENTESLKTRDHIRQTLIKRRVLN